MEKSKLPEKVRQAIESPGSKIIHVPRKPRRPKISTKKFTEEFAKKVSLHKDATIDELTKHVQQQLLSHDTENRTNEAANLGLDKNATWEEIAAKRHTLE